MSGADQKYQLIKTYVRQRPATQDEIESNRAGVVQSLTLRELVITSGTTEKKYYFDHVFGGEALQVEVYDVVISPLIESVIDGYNCTVFAYGQTGTGKTHTMIGGNISKVVNFGEDSTAGMIPRAAAHLFHQLTKIDPDVDYTVSVSFTEIYNEEVRDLLVRDSLPLRIYEDPDNRGSIFIRDLTEATICNTGEAYEWLKIGALERQTAATKLNRHSSRSHTIFTFLVHTKETTAFSEELTKTGKLHLIDLAGSENVGRSGATEMRAREAGTINKSLLTLGKVIKALAQKAPHVPYRDSKLTRILQDSLGGNTKTCLIATFSPCFEAWDETVSTLDYAYVARKVANCPTVNVNKKQAVVVQEYKDEIERLRQEVAAARTGEGFFVSKATYEKMQQDIESRNERIMTLLDRMQTLEELKNARQLQFAELEESFRTTASYLASNERKLDETKRLDRKNERVLTYLDERERELSETASVLLDVCETSTKHEDIYRAKHEKQSVRTAVNADIAKDVVAVAKRSLTSVRNAAESFVRGQSACLSDTLSSVGGLRRNQIDNERELLRFAEKIERKFDEDRLTLEDLLKNEEDYSEDMIKQRLDDVSKHNTEVHVQRQTRISSSADKLQDRIEKNNERLQARADSCVDAISVESKQQNENFEAMNTSLSKLSEKMDTRRDRIEKRLQDLEAMKRLFEPYRDMCDNNDAEVEEELADIEKMFAETLDLAEKLEDQQSMLKTKVLLTGLRDEYAEAATSATESIDEVIRDIRETEATAEKQILSHKSETLKYFSGLFDACQSNAERFNEELNTFFNERAQELDGIHSSLHAAAVEHCDHIKNGVEQVANAETEFSTNLTNFIQNSCEELGKMQESVEVAAHAGDTPAKPVYDYPKHLKERLSTEELMEQSF